MRHDLLEFVQAAHVVLVPVSGDGDDGPLEQFGELTSKARDAAASVHEEITLARADEIQVRPEQGVHVRLGDPQDAFIDLADIEPRPRHTHRSILDGARVRPSRFGLPGRFLVSSVRSLIGQLLGEVAGGHVLGSRLAELGVLDLAALGVAEPLAQPAPCVEPAAARR
jgi:hypothetical protein